MKIKTLQLINSIHNSMPRNINYFTPLTCFHAVFCNITVLQQMKI